MQAETRVIKAPIAVAGALAILLIGAVATSADTSVWHSGTYGVHYLADSAEYPGVICTYNSGNVISTITVRDPFVFAAATSQPVAWYFTVESSSSTSGPWSTVTTSALQQRTATRTQVANFTPLSRSFAGNASKIYRVQVRMRWYNGTGTTITGRAIHRADWYSWVIAPSFRGYCPGGIL